MEPLRFAGKIARAQSQIGKLLFILLAELELKALPAFGAEAHETAARVEQRAQFFLRERRVGDIERDAEIEPVDPCFLDIEFHLRRDRVVAE